MLSKIGFLNRIFGITCDTCKCVIIYYRSLVKVYLKTYQNIYYIISFIMMHYILLWRPNIQFIRKTRKITKTKES